MLFRSLELARLAGLRAGAEVLDVGGGLGGPARTLALRLGCRVTVLDVTEEYCRVGVELTRRTGLAGRVSFHHGDALALPFADARFDVVWTQHSSMNVDDKEALYAGIHRALRRGGRLGGAGLDVFDREPLPPDHPLLACEQVVLTPHNADQTPEGMDLLNAGVVDNVIAFLEGRPQNVVT